MTKNTCSWLANQFNYLPVTTTPPPGVNTVASCDLAAGVWQPPADIRSSRRLSVADLKAAVSVFLFCTPVYSLIRFLLHACSYRLCLPGRCRSPVPMRI